MPVNKSLNVISVSSTSDYYYIGICLLFLICSAYLLPRTPAPTIEPLLNPPPVADVAPVPETGALAPGSIWFYLNNVPPWGWLLLVILLVFFIFEMKSSSTDEEESYFDDDDYEFD